MKSVSIRNNSKNSLAGEQKKFNIDGKWYKIDAVSGQGFVEYLSRLVVNYSNIRYKIPDYIPLIINGKTGCVSSDISDNNRLVTLSNLYMEYTGRKLEIDTCNLPDIRSKIACTLDFLCNTVGMNYNMIGNFFNVLFQLDTLLINPDRHFNNIEFIVSSMGYQPILIDFGRSLLCISDEVVKIKDIDIDGAIGTLNAKPFGSFDEQYYLFPDRAFKIDYIGLLSILDTLQEVPFFFRRILMYQLRKYRADLSCVALARLVYNGVPMGYRAISLNNIYDFKSDYNLPSYQDIPLTYDGKQFITPNEYGTKVREVCLSNNAIKVLFS